jgi:hypothetical protein
MSLQQLEKPQVDSQQQQLEALLPPQDPKLMVNPLQPGLRHQHPHRLNHPPLYQLLPLPPTTLPFPPAPIRDLLLLPRLLLLGVPVMDLPLRQRRLRLYLRNLAYPPLQLWPRRNPRYVFTVDFDINAHVRTRQMSLQNIDDLQRTNCMQSRNPPGTDNWLISRNSLGLSRYGSAENDV